MSHRLSRTLLAAAVLISAFTVTQRAASGDDPTTVSVSPAIASVTVGDDVALDINAANVPAQPGIGGYLLTLTWDPVVLSLTSFADAGWVPGGQIIVICTTPTIDNVAGTASADCTPVFGFGGGVSTSAPRALAHAVFRAVAPGSTAIDLTGSNLLNTSNIAIASTLTGGHATVSAAAAATNTPLPASTSTPISGTTSTAHPSSTAAPVQGTDTPAAASASTRSTSTGNAQALSTKPAPGTLSSVEVPPAGSGTGDGGGGTPWRIPILAALGALLLGVAGFTAFRWMRGSTVQR